MAHQRDPVRVAAQRSDMFVRPRDRCRAVLQKVGPMRLGHQPVIGDDGDEALPRQRASRKAVTAPLAAVPAAAMEEDDHGKTIACLGVFRSEEHTSELQSLMRISYAVFCLKKKNII